MRSNVLNITALLFLSLTGAGLTPARAEWVHCPGRKVWVGDPGFQAYGTDVYYNGAAEMIFIDQKSRDVRFCRPLGYGEALDGFYPFNAGKSSGEEKPVFAVRGWNDIRYYDIGTGRQVYVLRDENGAYFISPSPEEHPGVQVPVLRQWYGQNSLGQDPELHRVTSISQWKMVWGKHKGPGIPVPEVDFSRSMVVAFFSGRQVSSVGIEAVDARELEEEIRLYIRPMWMWAWGGEAGGQPVGFFALPRSAKKIVVLQSTFIQKGYPLDWEEIGVIP